MHFQGGTGYMSQDVHMRDTIKYTDYKRFGSTIKIIYDGQDITKNGQQQGQPAQQDSLRRRRSQNRSRGSRRTSESSQS